MFSVYIAFTPDRTIVIRILRHALSEEKVYPEKVVFNYRRGKNDLIASTESLQKIEPLIYFVYELTKCLIHNDTRSKYTKSN